jgi:hypothetical protein
VTEKSERFCYRKQFADLFCQRLRIFLISLAHFFRSQLLTRSSFSESFLTI